MYDQYFITLYNIVYTSLPVLAMGVFDQVCGRSVVSPEGENTVVKSCLLLQQGWDSAPMPGGEAVGFSVSWPWAAEHR